MVATPGGQGHERPQELCYTEAKVSDDIRAYDLYIQEVSKMMHKFIDKMNQAFNELNIHYHMLKHIEGLTTE